MKSSSFLIVVLLISCWSRAQVVKQLGYTQQGKASYYPDDRNKAKTRSGEIYDMRELAAAHPFLAFNSVIKVTNLENGLEAILRINDRPYTNDRVLDVTLAAAQQLGMIGKPTTLVKIEVIALDVPRDVFPKFLASLEKKTEKVVEKEIDSPYTDTSGKKQKPQGLGLQIGLFTEFSQAQQKAIELQKKGFSKVFIHQQIEKNKIFFKVVVGEYSDRPKAHPDALKLKKMGYDCFVRPYSY
ncbi:MAG: septal ring lytic transglycosylase RlpA family protein [Cytophagales bacterium]|nr:septal ring lytic transglycosylase RlpA family protein [Cytophagales bacterium]MDW8384754.1 septal ring lytic transglycosylase RlpA family protein [Flammeovirgaceae bacterium]